ncbi:MAG: hypothetical protein ACRD0C_16080 [Acidimicrobiia bacterium]
MADKGFEKTEGTRAPAEQGDSASARPANSTPQLDDDWPQPPVPPGRGGCGI